MSTAVLFLTLAIAGVAWSASPIDTQRELFRDSYSQAELGIWSLSTEEETLLADYILWPDLKARYLRARLGRVADAEVREFLDRHGTLKPARDLRYRYSLHLASSGRLDDYMDIYSRYYEDLGIAKLDCLALQAEIADGGGEALVGRADKLWLVGKSQVDECDPVFEYLRDHDLLTSELYARRFQLAVGDRSFSLARYLAKSLDDYHREQADLWIQVSGSTKGYFEEHERYRDTEKHIDRLLYAVERTAYRDPATAVERWEQVQAAYSIDQARRNDVERHLALWSARNRHPDATALLDALPDTAVDIEVLRWRARTGLISGDWDDVATAISEMHEDELDDEWRYWLGQALRETGEPTRGETTLRTLAEERSFYGFLAADELDVPYALSHQTMQADEVALAELGQRDALRRALELFMVGLEGPGRSEWDAAISFLNQQQMEQAAILAHRWGWHSRAIATVARSGNYDDLDIRYPLPWEQSFETHASEAAVSKSWAYGIARSESLFMRDVRSHAGAIGVMQLLPETGRMTAKQVNQPYSGLVTLTDPEQNIRLGTHYLAKMYRRFDENSVLATAAYNAGPHRVDDWLPESQPVDARVWIENIPYNETRSYVRRVLTTDVIFHWRLTGEVKSLSGELTSIGEPVSQ